jgi:hypothetical protein
VRSASKFGIAFVATICFALGVALWISAPLWSQHNPQDFEQCAEDAERTASSMDERTSLIAECDKRFVGRRKMGGGYTYYDFLQNRHFDMAGPNPTAAELKHFDEEYALYLDTQRQFPATSALADKQGEDRLTGSIPSPGPPIVITPTKVPIPKARRLAVRPIGPLCEDLSLSCSWTKFSAGILNFLGSNAKANGP